MAPAKTKGSFTSTARAVPLQVPHLADTSQEPQLAFKVFEIVHFSPGGEGFVIVNGHGNELRRESARKSLGGLSLDAVAKVLDPAFASKSTPAYLSSVALPSLTLRDRITDSTERQAFRGRILEAMVAACTILTTHGKHPISERNLALEIELEDDIRNIFVSSFVRWCAEREIAVQKVRTWRLDRVRLETKWLREKSTQEPMDPHSSEWKEMMPIDKQPTTFAKATATAHQRMDSKHDASDLTSVVAG